MAAAAAPTAARLTELKLETNEFLPLLGKFVSLAKHLQNNAPDLVPKEDLVADEVISYLKPYSAPHGPLEVRKATYHQGRSNLIITYKGTTDGVISFVGSHMDVVPANPEEWSRDPFKLERDGDKLYGRGVTDCLGHVALITNFLKQLAVTKPVLKHSIIVVFIANEENSSVEGVGMDALQSHGELEVLRKGPLYWIDSANMGPTLGTGGMLTWKLTVNGEKGHSGVPQAAINALELAMEAIRHAQERFFRDFSRHEEKEREYRFASSSSMKPTIVTMPPSSVNQIPGQVTLSGDVRLTPFYNVGEAKRIIEGYFRELDVKQLRTLGASRYELPSGKKGALVFEWTGHPTKGVAVDMSSPGYKALHAAIATAAGEAKPFSLTGSLPIVADLKEAGFDVQICGFGNMEAYHANNEYGHLSGFEVGFRALAHVVVNLEK